MTRSILLFTFFIALFACTAQNKVSIGFVGEYSENFSIRNYSGGIQVEFPIGDYITLNYKGMAGGSTNRTFYVHAPLGAAVGSVIVKYLGTPNSTFVNALGTFLYSIPEGV